MKHLKQLGTGSFRATTRGKSITAVEARMGLAMSIPGLLAILAVVLLPLTNALILSTQKKDLARPQLDEFAGVGNYVHLVGDERFTHSMKVTLFFALVSIAIELPLAVAMASVLAKAFRGRGFVRAIVIVPWALPAVVSASMWKSIYNADSGLLNAILSQLGLIDQYYVWLADPKWSMALIILANTWKETPLTTLLVLGSLMAIPASLYEAAEIDGANAWARFRHITLPLIKPILIVAGLLQLIWGFQTFEIPQIITGGGPQSATDLISIRIYSTTFRSLRFGLGAAMAYFVAIILMVPAILSVRRANKSIVEM